MILNDLIKKSLETVKAEKARVEMAQKMRQAEREKKQAYLLSELRAYLAEHGLEELLEYARDTRFLDGVLYVHLRFPEEARLAPVTLAWKEKPSRYDHHRFYASVSHGKYHKTVHDPNLVLAEAHLLYNEWLDELESNVRDAVHIGITRVVHSRKKWWLQDDDTILQQFLDIVEKHVQDEASFAPSVVKAVVQEGIKELRVLVERAREEDRRRSEEADKAISNARFVADALGDALRVFREVFHAADAIAREKVRVYTLHIIAVDDEVLYDDDEDRVYLEKMYALDPEPDGDGWFRIVEKGKVRRVRVLNAVAYVKEENAQVSEVGKHVHAKLPEWLVTANRIFQLCDVETAIHYYSIPDELHNERTRALAQQIKDGLAFLRDFEPGEDVVEALKKLHNYLTYNVHNEYYGRVVDTVDELAVQIRLSK